MVQITGNRKLLEINYITVYYIILYYNIIDETTISMWVGQNISVEEKIGKKFVVKIGLEPDA